MPQLEGHDQAVDWESIGRDKCPVEYEEVSKERAFTFKEQTGLLSLIGSQSKWRSFILLGLAYATSDMEVGTR